MLCKTAGTDKMINRKTLFGGLAALSIGLNLALALVGSLQRSVIEQQKSKIASLKAEASQTPDQITDLNLPAGLVVQDGKFVCLDGGQLILQTGQNFQDCDHSFGGYPVTSENQKRLTSSTPYNLGKPLTTMTMEQTIKSYQGTQLPTDGSIMAFKIGVAGDSKTFLRFHRPIELQGGSRQDENPNLMVTVYKAKPAS